MTDWNTIVLGFAASTAISIAETSPTPVFVVACGDERGCSATTHETAESAAVCLSDILPSASNPCAVMARRIGRRHIEVEVIYDAQN
jgi:hypothetical protein